MAHLLNAGLERDAPRIALIVRDLAPVPIQLLNAAMTYARQTHTGSFPPTTGQIIEAAKVLCQRGNPDRYRNPLGGPMLTPRWYRNMHKLERTS